MTDALKVEKRDDYLEEQRRSNRKLSRLLISILVTGAMCFGMSVITLIQSFSRNRN